MIETLNKIVNQLPSGTAILPISLIVDFILRIFPSDKPRGILHFAGDLLKGFGSLFSKIGEISDSILPQNIKDPLK